MKFEDVYEEYKIFAQKRQKKQSFESLTQRFNSHILPYFRNKNINDLSIQDIIIWQNEILKYHFSNNYNKNLHFLLSGFLNYCCLFHGLEKNVASQVGCFKKKYEKDKHDFYTLEEFRKFIKAVYDPVYKQFFTFMFFTGTRPGEAMALRFSDFKGNVISISKTMNSHGKREISTPKTFSSKRDIWIDKYLTRDLIQLKEYYVRNYKMVDFDYYIFGGIKPLSPTTINRHKLKACELANIRPITLHQFRHSHATLLHQNRVLIDDIKKRLGHSKVSTTYDIYIRSDSLQEKRVCCTLNSIRNNFFQSLTQRFNKKISNIMTFLQML